MRAFVVCVPARNEAERLPMLLDALAAQTIDAPVKVAVCVNNSDDRSAAIAREIGGRSSKLDVLVEERRFAAADAHAGTARRCAMDSGATLLARDDGVLISTDADCRPPPEWIAANLAAIAGAAYGDRIVGGRIVLDDAEALPDAAGALRARWDRYWSAVRAVEDRIDPRPDEADGRHGDHTGASLAMPVGLYRIAGGVPRIAQGEDRALVENAILAGGTLVHPADVWTRVSPRKDGRAAGGMANDMMRLAADAAAGRVPHVPSFERWEERARWRRERRRSPDGDRLVVLAERDLPPMPHDMPLPGLG